MITDRLNLICPEGHRWFAPHPERWVGRECGCSRSETKPRPLMLIRRIEPDGFDL